MGETSGVARVVCTNALFILLLALSVFRLNPKIGAFKNGFYLVSISTLYSALCVYYVKGDRALVGKEAD